MHRSTALSAGLNFHFLVASNAVLGQISPLTNRRRNEDESNNWRTNLPRTTKQTLAVHRTEKLSVGLEIIDALDASSKLGPALGELFV